MSRTIVYTKDREGESNRRQDEARENRGIKARSSNRTMIAGGVTATFSMAGLAHAQYVLAGSLSLVPWVGGTMVGSILLYLIVNISRDLIWKGDDAVYERSREVIRKEENR